jgi:hypothetical protein
MNFVEVGSRLKLWSSLNGLHLNKLVISSHGIPRLFNRQFTVPAGTTIVFYGPHGLSLVDPGFKLVVDGWVRPYESKNPLTTCPDYSLTKWQGYHDNPWARLPFAGSFLGDGKETYAAIDDYLTNLNPTNNTADVLTIRATPGQISITLSFVLKELRKNSYNYSEIRCCFCRGVIGGYNAIVNDQARIASMLDRSPATPWNDPSFQDAGDEFQDALDD